MKFNLEDYAPVEERLRMFLDTFPDARVETELVRLEPPLVVFRASIFCTSADERPKATGYAYEKEGDGPVNRTSYVENCETSALGRALANAGYQGKRDHAPRPSREEMQKVERMSNPNIRAAWDSLIEELGGTEDQVNAFAFLMPGVPNLLNEWAPPHFEVAMKVLAKRGIEALESALNTKLDMEAA